MLVLYIPQEYFAIRKMHSPTSPPAGPLRLVLADTVKVF